MTGLTTPENGRRHHLQVIVVRIAALLLLPTTALLPAPARAQVLPVLIPPVDAIVARPFVIPSTEYGPGHRGIDYPVAAGTRVRAAAAGMVVFAGPVAGTSAVTVSHGGGLETTYSDLAEVYVAVGTQVERGGWLGAAGRAHSGGDDGLHFGVKLDDAYVDPVAHMGAIDPGGAIHLAPLMWRPPPSMPDAFAGVFTAGDNERQCATTPPRDPAPDPPNDNLAVAVAGISSKTAGGVDAAIYRAVPEQLGYPPERTYEFSYRGSGNASLHEPYERSDTFGDLEEAARKLAALLGRIARRHPGAAVDLIAHSQGGIVARRALQVMAEDWDPRLPRIEHLVTYASPHTGAPLASIPSELDVKRGGRALLHALSWASDRGVPVPDPRAQAVAQLAPGSDLMDALASEDVSFGTRVLSLASPHDVIVPADRARLQGRSYYVAPPHGANGHDGIVASPAARAVAYDFLRDTAPACRGPWDLWGPRLGRVVGSVEAGLGAGLATAIDAIGFGVPGFP